MHILSLIDRLNRYFIALFVLQKVTVEYVPQVGYLVAVNEHEVHLLDHILPTQTAQSSPASVSYPRSTTATQPHSQYMSQYNQYQQHQQPHHPTNSIPYTSDDLYAGEEEFLAWAEPSDGHGQSFNHYPPAYHHQVPFVEHEEPVQVSATPFWAFIPFFESFSH